MSTIRHFFITDSLDEVEQVETELKEQGITTAHFHVLSRDDVGMDERGLNSVHSLMRKDLIRSGFTGAATGVALAAAVLAVAGVTGLTASAAGWIPFIFLSIVVFGFCTWEGGLYGIQEPNRAFEKFDADLDSGKHIIFVDGSPAEKNAVLNVMQNHERVTLKSIEVGRPAWIIRLFSQRKSAQNVVSS